MKPSAKFSKKQQNIISIIALVIVVLIIIIIVAVINLNDKKGSASPTAKPESTAQATASIPPTDAVSAEPANTPESEGQSSDTAKSNDSAQSAAASTITDSASLQTAQTQFDQYIANKNYSGALDLLKNSFSNSSYFDSKLNTYQNYVTYYESQGKYAESLSYQLDYIEKEDGLDNVVSGSTHYKLLQQTLQKTSSSDSRIQKIQDSVDRWTAIDELRKQNAYSDAEQKLLKMKEDGLDCVILYSYLGKIYDHEQKYKEEMELYFSFIDSRSSYNSLESDYVSIFEDTIGAMYYAGVLTDEDIEPYSDRVKTIKNE